ncbi:hypothetical protein MFIFM68171_07773 [Madurella fahalii]|uniref:Uncharacterized protein n=1 Tax=Madurella fahalii TaxID=1157608 RepID=A0ABQ0GIH6_9PEZI
MTRPLPAQYLEERDFVDWSAGQIMLMISTSAITCAALMAFVISEIRARRRAVQLEAELDNATAELGVQRKRISALEQDVQQRDKYILRNIVNGPEVCWAASPTRSTGVLSINNRPGQTPPLEDAVGDSFTPGSDVGNDFRSCHSDSDSDGDKDENVEAFRSLTPRPAVIVQPHNIRMITLSPKGQNREDVDPDNVGPRGFQRGRDTRHPLEVCQDDDQQRKETFGPSEPQDLLWKEGAPEDRFARYWLDNGADDDQSAERSVVERPKGIGVNIVDNGCAVLENGLPAEVETTATEANEGYQSTKRTSAARVSSSSSSSPSSSISSVSELRNGAEFSESSMSPCPSLPSPAATMSVPQLKPQLENRRWTAVR